jgi:hypothetical protein
MDFFYDQQIRRYLTQFMRVMSNFGYKDSKGQVIKVPVRYGDMNRQVASILKKNSENTIASAPFIACYIKDLQFDRPRMQDPTFVSTINIREREKGVNNEYYNAQGANYSIERIMPTPYVATFSSDIWTTNLDQKLQLWEQIVILFTPSLEIQTTDNYIDWTSLSLLELTSQNWSSRSVPQGLDQDIDVLTLNFSAPIWITPPAKVKKLGIITKIITNIFAVNQGTIESEFLDSADLSVLGEADSKIIITPGDYNLLVINNSASLISNHNDDVMLNNYTNWLKLLDLYPGKFRAGLSQLRLTKPDGTEIVSYISLDPTDETKMILNFDNDTIPTNTIIQGRGTVDAIINPESFKPQNLTSGTRYLILENINKHEQFTDNTFDGPDAWKNLNGTDFQANANDIIEWDGSQWNIIFDSVNSNQIIYITNSYTGVQYKWNEGSWSKSFEGIYDKELWRIIL